MYVVGPGLHIASCVCAASVSNVVKSLYMRHGTAFDGASQFNGDVSLWDVSSVTTMERSKCVGCWLLCWMCCIVCVRMCMYVVGLGLHLASCVF